ncbi:MAG: hypothetical protein KC613_04770 [Myxococcales bacterium]|nr:hypothetical protein [Myxococcales bacterium]MCB9526762.1 hypothetical protein [Myxococcales bacterium]
MADHYDDDAPKVPADLLPELQAKAELAARKVDLLERRIAAWEDELAQLRKLLKAIPTAEAVDAPQARMDDLEGRVARLEKRSFRAMAGQAMQRAGGTGGAVHFAGPELDVPADARALVFATWTPLDAAAGEPVTLSVMVDGFDPEDVVSFAITDLAGDAVDSLSVPVARATAEKVSAAWTPPAPGKGGHREFRFTASCRGREDRSPVLTVRG